ncbi:hypothetical protein FZEAL_5890 [Fusarium zealandicum]|uniref:Calcineurin-like phosphoesterase domain-containing protein n=1 Tax=Fusarium zealandicum TaxID=1053134 RepID=A0A8H4UJC4_9HYPO|nr:hypothetical protein FZEAL_5890 [Fusarium zealandicum]
MLPSIAIASFAVLAHAAVPRRRASNDDSLAPLQFTSEGTFQIAVFSDLHFGQLESTTGPAQDSKSVEVISSVLDSDPPDLVVLNGDLINGDSTHAHNSTHYVDQIVAPIVKRNLTWASTYGNHDNQINIAAKDILKREQMWPGCRTQKMVDEKKSGVSNYYLVVYPANCTDSAKCTPELLLWFFDSRGGNFYEEGSHQENWVDTSVVSWFNETNTKLVTKYKKVIPSLAFVHIPINATEALQTQLGINANKQPGLNYDPPVPQQGESWCESGVRDPDKCSYGGQDEPFMEALVSIPGIMGLFYGHDHGNSWCYQWNTQLDGMDVKGNGLHLCYGQHSGYGGYGDWVRGAREIVVTQDKLQDLVVDTHIRLETGDVVGAVTLNSTYNTDHYPAMPGVEAYVGNDFGVINSNAALTESAGSSMRARESGGVYLAIGASMAAVVCLCI